MDLIYWEVQINFQDRQTNDLCIVSPEQKDLIKKEAATVIQPL
jgi:hypothetical protein